MGVCAIGLRVASARRAFERAIELGAWAFEGEKVGVGELKIPAIQGIGDSHLYFVDRWRGRDGQRGGVGDISIFDIDFRPIDIATAHTDLDCVGVGLQQVDHFTQTVGAGRMQEWLDFYHDLLHFREIHEIDAHWHVSEESRVMVSPCGAVRIPVYEEGTRRTELMMRTCPTTPVRACSTSRWPPTTSCPASMRCGRTASNSSSRRLAITTTSTHGCRGTASTSTRCAAARCWSTARSAAMACRACSSRPSSSAGPARSSSKSCSARHHGFGEGNLAALARARDAG